jgi:hypothetical protein
LVAEASLYDYVPTARDNGGATPVDRIRWRRAVPLPLPKVAVRAEPGLVIHEGNHGVTLPSNGVPPIVKHLLTVRHFPYRSAEHMVSKARKGAEALSATDLPEEVGAHWRGYGRLTDKQLHDVFREHFFSDDPVADGLVEDPVR